MIMKWSDLPDHGRRGSETNDIVRGPELGDLTKGGRGRSF